MAKLEYHVSVPLDREQREFLEKAAEREDRTVAGQVRHYLAQVMRPRPLEGRRA